MARRDWRTWALSAGAPLLLGIGLSGCGGSSSGGGGFASTAAGSTPAATTSSSAAGSTSNSNAIPQAPASQGVPLTVFNQELQQVWDKMRPQILAQLDTLAASKLAGQKYQSSAVEVEVRNVKLGSTTDMNVAPGLLRLDTQQIELRAPIVVWRSVPKISAQLSINAAHDRRFVISNRGVLLRSIEEHLCHDKYDK